MSTILEVILKTAGFTEGATAIKKVGDEATNTNNKLKTTTSTVDQVSKSTTSLGSKLANAGKQFSGTITNVAALGSTVVNLKRQYDDLSDTQIRVDKTQLKVSRSAEAVRAAQGKLNDAVKKYGKGSAEAQKAQLDLTQAQEASTLAVTMNGEALEDQQRAYENFAMNLAPTILTAGSSITSMFKEIGGTKGIGGLANKLKTLGTSMKGIGGTIATSLSGGTTAATKSIGDLTSKITDLGNVGKGGGGALNNLIGSKTKITGLLGIAAAAGVAYIGIQKIFDLMEQKKNIQIDLGKIDPKTQLAPVATLQKTIVDVTKNKEDLATKFWDFMKKGPIGAAIWGPTTDKVATEVIKSLESSIERQKQIDILTPLFKNIEKSGLPPSAKASAEATLQKIIDIYKNASNFKNADFTATTTGILTKLFDQFDTQLHSGSWSEGLSGSLLTEFNKVWQAVEAQIKLKPTAPMTALFALDAKPISASNDILGKYAATIKNFGATVANAGTQVATAAAPINYLTGLVGKMREAFTSIHTGAEFTGLTKAFAIDPKPIAQTGDAIGKLANQISNFSTKIDPGAAKIAAYASQARFLDENLKPLGIEFDQVAAALEKANAGLAASGSGLSNYQIGINAAVTSVAEWNTQSQIKIAQDTQELTSIKKLAQSYGIHTGAVGNNIEVLKLLIQAQQAAAQGNMAMAASFLSAAKAAQNATKAIDAAAKAAQRQRMVGSGVKVPKGTTVNGPVTTYHGQKYYTTPTITGYRYVTPKGKIKRHKTAQTGMHEFLKEDTMITAHKGERADIDKPGRGGSTHITISFEPAEFAQFIRYRINDNQGVVK